MTAFLESPWPAFMTGIMLELILAIALFALQRRGIAIAMGVVAALVVGLIVLERVVVTPAEEVENALFALADRLEANDVKGAVALVAPDATKVISAAERHMPRYYILGVHIKRDLTVTINDTNPPTAVAKFTCYANAKDKKGQLPYENAMLQFAILYRKDGDRWLIYEYDVNQPEIRMGK